MDIHAVFGVEPNYHLTEAEVAKYNLPDVFISLKASDWLNEEKVASKFVASVFGDIDSSASTLSSINQALLKINEIADLPSPIRELSNYTRRHYQKKKIIARFDHYLSLSKDAYQLNKAKQDAVNSLLEENYRMHGSLAGKTADGILEAAGASGYKKNDTNDSDDSCTSQKYHPKRSRKYSVSVPKDDYEGLPVSEGSEMMKELKEFRYRSIELTKTNANQVSDLRLLSLDCIYLFSEDIKTSVSKYLGTDWHNNLISSFIDHKDCSLNPIVYSWCMKLTNFKFNNNSNKWMELQAATINMLAEAINTNDKATVQIANMLHTIAPRLYISTNELNVEDTFIHTVFSYAIKLIFGIEDLLNHQWANSRLNQQHENDQGKFKPDYIAYIKVRSIRHDVTIAEVKPTNAGSGRPPSDLVKLGQQMKVMLNNLVIHRVDSPTVCGILVEGSHCSLYKMNLIGHHFYPMVLLSSFSLCTSITEISLIPNMFLCLNNLKTIAVDTAKKIESNELTRAKGKRKFEKAVPTSWVHGNTCTFSIVKESDN